ncbi:alpha/beta hydrolase [Bacteriovorax sp. DB6_IX]|uniref:alpha/beta hydrolase n=1 Tax=Bacteriovorax sp. DB6_IX TaxID=1353530 RepID=UPI000389E77A|nr:alpha/beta fold hydrolase [Bacteriovorax sp. DB6_IX]EQC50953.1 alpha/beta hydrolase family protein [Bacteriovorax sp. DB6_IX]
MNSKILKVTLEVDKTIVNAMAFLPPQESVKEDRFAIFTHGYTSHKGSLLNWAARVSEENVPAIIFDQPGHFLGSYHEIEGLDVFKDVAPQFFLRAYEYLKSHYPQGGQKLVIGGHSLGALTSLMALERELFTVNELLCVCVGFGLPPAGVTHIFSTPFYKSTLNLRGQLVSENIPPEQVFPWIKEKKEELEISRQRIHFITGDDDVVVGKDGSERLVEFLEEQGNHVTIEKPKRLAHHMPELAAAHIKKFLKDSSFL